MSTAAPAKPLDRKLLEWYVSRHLTFIGSLPRMETTPNVTFGKLCVVKVYVGDGITQYVFRPMESSIKALAEAARMCPALAQYMMQQSLPIGCTIYACVVDSEQSHVVIVPKSDKALDEEPTNADKCKNASERVDVLKLLSESDKDAATALPAANAAKNAFIKRD